MPLAPNAMPTSRVTSPLARLAARNEQLRGQLHQVMARLEHLQTEVQYLRAELREGVQHWQTQHSERDRRLMQMLEISGDALD